MIGSDTAVVQGIQGAFWNTLRGFHRFWERIDIICPFVAKMVNPDVFGNVHFHPLPRGKGWMTISVLQKGLKVCRKSRPDLIVIHAYGMQMMSWGGWLLAQRLGIPFVVEVHHIEGIPRVSATRDYLRYAASLAFLRCVREEAAAFRVVNRAELLPVLIRQGVSPDKVKVVYSVYLDTAIFHPMPDSSKKYDIVFVGRLVPNKGLFILFHAFQYLRRQIPSARWLIVGRGPLEGWVKGQIHARNGIEYIPSLKSAVEVAQAYNQAKVAVCASSAEGGPRYMVEAMACGLPGVSTPVGLMKEVIQDGKNGFLLQSWSPSEVAEQVSLLLTDSHLYARCSQNAQKIARQFEYTRMITVYAETYQVLIQQSL
jgi:glycosyltransferase involved in cell wall biosynthesis